MPDFVVGLHIATGSGRTLWLERASKPVCNEAFVAQLGAELIRDDDVFNAAVVSFGTFGIIAAVALETAPIYHLDFPAVGDIHHDALKAKLRSFGEADPDLYHYEFIFDPHGRSRSRWRPRRATCPSRPACAHRSHAGSSATSTATHPGSTSCGCSACCASCRRGSSPAIQFKQYRRIALLNDVRGTPGQLYTSSIYYLEGYTESAFAVSVRDAPEVIDICSAVARELRLPSISQVRLVHRSQATLGFTQHEPKSAVFEVGLIDDERFPEFERRLDVALRSRGHPLHGALVQELRDRPGEARLHVRRAADRELEGGAPGRLRRRRGADAVLRDTTRWCAPA